ncbi:histidine kinase [Streptomyces cinnamoneus]|uniref:histidine kinase n=1 Tax=Streptomyces cinnamoneus TaxID=53446 RepID=A0A918U1U4_STRCJ|nr:histidine kinase [Streptomyces cinnamoneus]
MAAATAAGLSLTSLWWALPAMAAAFFAGHRSGRTWPMAAALSVLVAAGAAAVVNLPTLLGLGTRFVAMVVGAALLPWFAGRVWRQYQELVRAGWSRAEQLEREQRLVAEQARLRERARIAQDMHDALGHDLSLIALSAGALKLAPGLADAHRAAAEDVRARAATAVERLGEVIGILREETQEAPAGPADFSIARLVEGANASGLETALHTDGEAGEVPAVVERAAHRVVQEALTNVAKHAPGAGARVHVAHTATETVVTVENAPPPAGPVPAGPLPGGGRGLVGLDERVRLAGGTFSHAPRADGGFTVTARLPHTPALLPPAPPGLPPAPPGLPAAPAALPPEHRRARRRAGRALVAAVVVPLLATVVLTGALTVWGSLTLSQSVLDPAHYAALHVGQNRSEVTGLLPARQLPYRPRAAEPKGRGVECAYYAVTADRFVDASGDAYQLCFQHGRLLTLAVLKE